MDLEFAEPLDLDRLACEAATSAYQRAQVHAGAQHIPGCVVFMLGMQPASAISEKPPAGAAP